jgi:hypothetical protein
VGPAEVLEEELPLPFELSDIVAVVVVLADACIMGLMVTHHWKQSTPLGVAFGFAFSLLP